jgi:lipopolysaccharide export system permease protein
MVYALEEGEKMNSILGRYLAKTILFAVLVVTIIILAAEIFIEFTREFPEIGTGYYGILQAFAFVPMIMPMRIYQIFPIICLLGSIMGLSLLAGHSELIIMRVSGVSLLSIFKKIFSFALVLAVGLMILGEALGPYAYQVAVTNKALAMSKGQALLTKEGAWFRDQNNFIYVEKVLGTGQVANVTRYGFDDAFNLKSAAFALSGNYLNGKWIFSDIVETDFNEDRVTTTKYPEQEWNLPLKYQVLGMTAFDPDQKSLPELWSYLKYRKSVGADDSYYQFIFWQRIFQPLAIIIMITVAIPFVFGPLRSTTIGFKALIAIICGFGFYLLNQFAGPFGLTFQIPPFLSALLPSAVFAALGGVVLAKMR